MDGIILDDIKKLLGLEYTINDFDKDLMININSVFMILNQMGVGPEETFYISGRTDRWSDFTDDETNLEAIKSYIYLKVKKIFDPSASSVVTQSNDELIKELEWRLNSRSEYDNN